MRVVVCALAALSLAACATAPVPTARPLNDSQIAALGPTTFTVVEDNNGVGKTWFAQDSSAAGAGYGLIGAIVTATMDAIVNSFPARRATKTANEIAEVMPVETLNASLTGHLRRQIDPAASTNAVAISDVTTVQRVETPTPANDTLEIASAYTLSEDASTLRIVTTLTYTNPDVPYVTPYTFEKSPPSTELTGPTYRNTFTYFSRQLPTPELTPELRERLIASVQDSARDENGALPVEGTDAFKAMTREMEQATDDNLTKGEISIFLAREWIRNNGALLRAEVDNAHALIARYALIDINRTAIPSLEGQDELVETLADGRTVRRLGAGVEAGSYISSPPDVTSFTTFGNTMSVAKVHAERLEQIRSAARARARAR